MTLNPNWFVCIPNRTRQVTAPWARLLCWTSSADEASVALHAKPVAAPDYVTAKKRGGPQHEVQQVLDWRQPAEPALPFDMAKALLKGLRRDDAERKAGGQGQQRPLGGL